MSRWREFAEKNLTIKIDGGNELYCLCVFHQDSSPSMGVNVEKGLFICYGCGEKGHISKIARKLGVDARPAPREGSDLVKMATKFRTEHDEDFKPRSEVWLSQFLHDTRGPRYWTGRLYGKKIIRDWQLGFDAMWANGGAATIPVRDSAGRLYGVIRRQMNGKPKYLNPKGFDKKLNLFGQHMVTEEDSSVLAICEGPTDALSLWNIGQPAVSLYGWHMSEHQAELIKRLNPEALLIFTDNPQCDLRGDDARERIRSLLGKFPAAMADYPNGIKDAGEMKTVVGLKKLVSHTRRSVRVMW